MPRPAHSIPKLIPPLEGEPDQVSLAEGYFGGEPWVAAAMGDDAEAVTAAIEDALTAPTAQVARP